jgi:hypothetical protein
MKGWLLVRDLGARLGQLLLAGSVATASLVLGAANVAAANPGPIGAPFSVLRDPGPIGCPNGLEVALPDDPAIGCLPGVALFKNPGPSGCALGVTVSKDPGPAQTPGTVAELPLNAADCAVGTASLRRPPMPSASSSPRLIRQPAPVRPAAPAVTLSPPPWPP